MQVKNVARTLEGSRRSSKLGDGLAKDKIEKARQLTPEQRLFVALELADATAALQRACSKQEALTKILSRLDAAHHRRLLHGYALIGGFAVSAWEVPRATQDIDFAIAIGAADPQALAIFLGGHFEAGDADDPLRGVVHTSIQVGSTSVPLQLIFFPSAYTEVAFQHIESLSIMEQVVPVVSWQALVLKLYAGGPQDKLDAQQILQVRRPQPDDLKQIGEKAKSLGILQDWTSALSLYQRKLSDL